MNSISCVRFIRHTGKHLLLTVCLILTFQNNWAQPDTLSVNKTDTIGPVVVTGQFREQPADKSIFSIDVIDSREIRQKAAINLGELLRSERSFNFHSADLLGDFIRIKGLTGEHIKVLVDGMPVTGRVNNAIDFGQLTLQNIDHIEIIEGPMSVIYGSNALAGVINIITSDHSGTPYFVSVNGLYESVGRYNAGILFSQQIKEHNFTLNGSRNFFGGWDPVDTSRYQSWKPKLQYTGGFTYRYQKNQFKASLNSDYMNEELRDPGALTLRNLYEKALDGYYFTTRWNNRLNVINTFHENFVFNLQAGYSYYKRKRITYVNDLVNLEKTISPDNALHDTTRFHLITLRGFASNVTGKKFEYQTGFDLNYESALGKHTNGKREISDVSAFMNFIYRPLKELSLQPGFRLMVNSDYKAPLVYGLSIKYDPKPFVLKASYAKGFRAPSLRQLYLQFIDNNHHILGNELLKPETADNLRLSLNYDVYSHKNAWLFDFGLFYNAIENAIQLALSKKQPGLGQYFNVANIMYKTKGAEFGIVYRRSPGVTISAGIISTGKVRLDDTDKFNWSTDFVCSSSWHIRKPGIELAAFYKYTDEYMEFAGNYDEAGSLNAVGQELTAGYHNLDLTVTKSLFKSNLNLSSGVKNVFNVKQVNSIGDINIHGSMNNSTNMGYGRSFFLSAVYSFSK